MDTAKLWAVEARGQVLLEELSHGVLRHPVFFGAALVFLLLTWGHFKGDYGPQTWALSKERSRVLRGTVHVLVMPLRLLAALLSSAVALLVIGLLVGFVYVLWRMLS
jgi:hypothetical protein